MADLGKVIQRIEYILSDNRSEDGFFLPVLETVETLEDALEFLKARKQTTAKEDYDGLYQCNKCGGCLGPIQTFKFCPWCGRAVKWDG